MRVFAFEDTDSFRSGAQKAVVVSLVGPVWNFNKYLKERHHFAGSEKAINGEKAWRQLEKLGKIPVKIQQGKSGLISLPCALE